VTPRERWALRLILVTGVCLRLAWALYARPAAPVSWYLSGDQFSYYHYGVEIARGNGYVSYVTGDATAYYPIGYPAILGALYFAVLHSPVPDDLMLATALLHVVVGSASVALVWVIGTALGGVRVGLLAAGLYAVFPNMIFQVSTVQLETMFVFLLLVPLAIAVTHDWAAGPPSLQRALAVGATLGVAVIVRPFAAVLLVGVTAALVVSRVGWRAVLKGAAVPLAVVILMSVPWTIRNAAQMHAFIPSSTNMGDTLCLDRNLDAHGGFRFADHDGCVDPGLAEVPRNAGNTRKAIRFVVEHPDRELLQIARRARIMFRDDHDGLVAVQSLGGGEILDPEVVTPLRAAADWYFYAVVALAAAGAPALLRRQQRAERLIVLSGLVGLLVIPLLLWGNPRFHLPLAPFLALCAATSLDAAHRAVARRRAARRDAGDQVPLSAEP